MKTSYKFVIFSVITFFTLQNFALGEAPMEKSLKIEAIKSLEMFHKETNGRLLELSPSQKTKVLPFVCKSNSSDSCDLQELNYRNANKSDTRVFAIDGMYRVDIAFVNNINIPRLPWNHETFIGKTREESEPIKLSAYEHFLGGTYEELQPEFITSGRDSILLKILVKDASELEQFISDDKVVGIWHIGNDQSTPEGY